MAAHVAERRYPKIHTRFPPEPNGYLHIGHAKSICLNFGIAREFGGVCNLRMDDTNPTKEEVEYVDSIMADVHWLISGWADDRLGLKPAGPTPKARRPATASLIFTWRRTASCGRGPNWSRFMPPIISSNFTPTHVALIQKGKAYVCDLSPEDTDNIAAGRTGPDGKARSAIARSRRALICFKRMKAGEFPDGARTLRARIDMASPNVWMRDPILYRIRHAEHHHTGNEWCIYPMYDFAHCLSDYLEGITHSICTLEFEVHRPLYDWILENLGLPRPLPHQYEFASLILSYTVVCKRKLI